MSHNSSICFTRRLSGFAFSFFLLFTFFTYSATAQEPQAPASDTAAAMQDTVATGGASIAGDIANGETLFSSYCAACHALDRKITGPALAGVNQRHDQQWLINWIHDSPGMVASGDPAAVAIFEEYNQSPMPPFPQLSEGEVIDILSYIEAETQALQQPAAPAAGGAEQAEDKGTSGITVIGLLVLAALLFLVTLVLNRTIGSLKRVILKNQGVEVAPEVTAKKDYMGALKSWPAIRNSLLFPSWSC
ncbi:c-type cytochrome [Anseongella ginsenosidimutans]|uniref:c-type cytochrome n=1 Tax=Anseongella ginsenosidimutans TaxID=496056 RepID=UPI0011C94A1C|nr:cytochrome c [Anseongella ginsenosidimutans]QEC51300.1 cytochrome c [Anseongella ginsenosidimutans]